MIPLTVTIITFNEEHNIRACLESVSWVKEIVVVDSGSTDQTVSIAQEFTDRIVVTDWPGHVDQKNRAVDLAPTDWVLCLDADERVSPEMRIAVEEILAGPEPEEAGFEFPRRTFYLGRWIAHGGWYPDRKVRLFDRRRGRWGGTNPHDHVEVDGRVRAVEADILHYTYRDIRHHLEVIDAFSDIAAREREQIGRRARLWMLLGDPPAKFVKMYVLKRGYRDGFAGFVVAGLGALYVFLKEAKLWERARLRSRGKDPDAMPRYARGPEYRGPEYRPPAHAPPADDPRGES